jgi:phenylacetic acid degradation operon negative regulatory protein
MASMESPDTIAIKALHGESRPRIWSLIVTIFGDVVMQQGTRPAPGPIWNGAILELLQLMKIEPGLVRTSLSRLVANDTLSRIKTGRNTYYELGEQSRKAFALASERIYGRQKVQPASRFDLVIIDRCPDRTQARKSMEKQGFRFIGATVALKARQGLMTTSTLPLQAIHAVAEPSKALSEAAREAFKVEALNEGYKRFLETFPAHQSEIGISDETAIITRILLVHQFRRLILRDPHLPTEALPLDWTGEMARQRFDENLAALSPQTQAWTEKTGFLDAKATSETSGK